MIDVKVQKLIVAALLMPVSACARTEPVPSAEADEIQAAVDRADEGAKKMKDNTVETAPRP